MDKKSMIGNWGWGMGHGILTYKKNRMNNYFGVAFNYTNALSPMPHAQNI